MKVGRVFLLLVFFCPTGCSFFYYGAQNLFSEPYNALQECAFRDHVRRLAKEAWQQTCATGGRPHSDPYAKGFEDGFVDFIDADGAGDPPAAATAHMRRELLHTPDGQLKIEDWYAGFRHGAQVARASGFREKYVMPIALPPKAPQDPMPAHVIVPIPAAEPVNTLLPPMSPGSPAPIIKPVAPVPEIKPVAPVPEIKPLAPAPEIKPAAPRRIGPVVPEPMSKLNARSISDYVTWARINPIDADNREKVGRVRDVD